MDKDAMITYLIGELKKENLEFVSTEMKEYITKTLNKLNKLDIEDLLNLRYEKYRKIGKMEE